MGMHGEAWKGLSGRYFRVFAHAWARRKDMEPPRRVAHEKEFLPAALSLQETPVHPLPRVVVGLILFFALLALIWAAVGRTDIVAVAEGRIVPDSRVQLVQATETASVRAIHVRDGQRVKAGEVLIELDGTLSGADVTRISREYRSARLAARRSEAFLKALDAEGSLPTLHTENPVPDDELQIEQRVLHGHVMHYRAEVRQMEAEIARRAEEVEVAKAVVQSLDGVVPIIQRRSEDLGALSEQGLAAMHEHLELEQGRIEAVQDLAAQRARLAEVKAGLNEAREQLAAFRAERQREALDALHEAHARAESLAQELVKVRQRDELTRLRAPMAGTVEQLEVHTVGGVVEPARPLMVIVPEDGDVEVEATLPNKDIGFVREGQAAEVKLQTFPYTRYGTVPGVVTDVSQDAIQDEEEGLVFRVRVRLDRETVDVHGESVRIAPGMASTVEVRTGQRRILEYFLTPFLQYASESLQER